MKSMIGWLMLLTGITGTAIAQNEIFEPAPGKVFDIDPGYFKRKFMVDLGRGNHMQVEAVEMEDMDQFSNIDSLLRIFLQDTQKFKYLNIYTILSATKYSSGQNCCLQTIRSQSRISGGAISKIVFKCF